MSLSPSACRGNTVAMFAAVSMGRPIAACRSSCQKDTACTCASRCALASGARRALLAEVQLGNPARLFVSVRPHRPLTCMILHITFDR